MRIFDTDALKKLYDSVGWVNYLKDLHQFEAMFQSAMAVYGAYEAEKLVGVLRLVGDNAHILYVQDIVVDPEYQARGIGKALMLKGLDDFKHVRQKVLITDMDDSHVHAFYESLGFNRSQDKNIVCYVKFD